MFSHTLMFCGWDVLSWPLAPLLPLSKEFVNSKSKPIKHAKKAEAEDHQRPQRMARLERQHRPYSGSFLFEVNAKLVGTASRMRGKSGFAHGLAHSFHLLLETTAIRSATTVRPAVRAARTAIRRRSPASGRPGCRRHSESPDAFSQMQSYE